MTIGEEESRREIPSWGENFGLLPTLEIPVQGNGSGAGKLTLGGGMSDQSPPLQPPPGIVWLLRRIIVLPWPNPATVITGTAAMFIVSSATQLTPWDCKDTTQQIPNTATWSRGEAPVDPGDMIICDMNGLPTPAGGQIIVVNVTVEWLPSKIYYSIMEKMTKRFQNLLEAPSMEAEDSELSRPGGLGTKEHSYRQRAGMVKQ